MKEIGLQSYTIRNYLDSDKDMTGAFRQVKEAGYASVQLWGPLEECEKRGRAAIEAGLRVLGTTGPTKVFFENPDETIAMHKRLGAIDVGIGGASCKTLAELREFIKQANEFNKKVRDAGKDYITIYYGEDVKEKQAQKAADLFADICPDADVNLLKGGQPVYYYLISAE